MRDPNPQVNGRGLRALRRAGVAVDVGCLAQEARRQNEAFVVAQEKGRPYVLLKVAMTLDGRTATARGDSKWITGPRERAEARRLRRLHDAVLVGIAEVDRLPVLNATAAVQRVCHRHPQPQHLDRPARVHGLCVGQALTVEPLAQLERSDHQRPRIARDWNEIADVVGVAV